MKTIQIEIYIKKEKAAQVISVEKLAENIFRMAENEWLYFWLPFGTEIETQINKDGKHEILKVRKESEYITRRFFLTAQFKESEYKVLGEEIMKHGGFWQVDFSSIATINLPKDCTLNIDEIFTAFDCKAGDTVCHEKASID